MSIPSDSAHGHHRSRVGNEVEEQEDDVADKNVAAHRRADADYYEDSDEAPALGWILSSHVEGNDSKSNSTLQEEDVPDKGFGAEARRAQSTTDGVLNGKAVTCEDGWMLIFSTNHRSAKSLHNTRGLAILVARQRPFRELLDRRLTWPGSRSSLASASWRLSKQFAQL